MIEIIKELNIEVSKPNVFQAIVAKQYDMNTRFVKATLVDNGEKITINQSPTLKVIINALRSDGESNGFDGVINDDGTVTVPLHSWMLELVGTVTCDISVVDTATDNNKKLTTTSFTLLVERAAWDGEGMSNDPQYNLLIELLNSCASAGEVAEEALQKSEEAIARASDVRGIYIGSGDMPAEYNVQIDPDSDALLVDKELDETSENLVTNKAITLKMKSVEEDVATLESAVNGKAPAGYGLGKSTPETSVKTPAELDNLNETGWYQCDFLDFRRENPDWNIHGITFAYATVHVVAIDAWTFYQTLYIHTANQQGLLQRGYYSSTGFTEWKCENPPMVVGQEYPTTELYKGKTVYTKLIDFGLLPERDRESGVTATKYVDHNVVNIGDVVSVSAIANQPGNKLWIDVQTSGIYQFEISATSVGMCEALDSIGVHGLYAMVTLKYTKEV